MTAISVRRLEFVRVPTSPAGVPPDRLDTGSVVLDPGKGSYSLSLIWAPTAASWYLDIRTVNGAPIVLGVAVRDRVDCLLGISTKGRPAGGIFSYHPTRRTDPDLSSWSDGVAGLYYLPAGLDPNLITKYPVAVI